MAAGAETVHGTLSRSDRLVVQAQAEHALRNRAAECKDAIVAAGAVPQLVALSTSHHSDA